MAKLTEAVTKAVKKEGVVKFVKSLFEDAVSSAREIKAKLPKATDNLVTRGVSEIEGARNAVRKALSKKADVSDLSDFVDKESFSIASRFTSVLENDAGKGVSRKAILAKVEKTLGNSLKYEEETFFRDIRFAMKDKSEHSIIDRVNTTMAEELSVLQDPTFNNRLLKNLKLNNTDKKFSSKMTDFSQYNKAGLTLKNKRVLAKELEKQVLAAREATYKNLSAQAKGSQLNLMTTTLEGGISELYEMSQRANMPAVAKAWKVFYKFIDNSHGDISRISSLSRSMNAEESVFEKKGTHKAIRALIERSNKDVAAKSNILDETNSIAKKLTDGKSKRVAVNKQVLEKVEQEYGLKLDVDDLEFANIKTNLAAYIQKSNVLRSQARINRESIPASVKEMKERNWGQDLAPDHWSNNFSSMEFADLGRSYHPTRITEEYLARINSHKGDAIAPKQGGKSFEETLNYHRAMRSLDSKAGLDVNRVEPREEINNMIYAFSNTYIKNIGNKMLKEIEGVSRSSAIINKKLGSGILDLNVLPKNKYEQYAKATAKQWDDAFKRPETPKNLFYRGFLALADTNTTMALTIMSPNLLISNSLQPMSTTAPFKGRLRTLVALKDVGGSFWKAILKGKGIDGAMDALKKGKLTTEEHTVLSKYLSKYKVDALQSEMWSGDFAKAKDILTRPFQYTDIFTRAVTATASIRKCNNVLDKHYNKMLTGGSKTHYTKKILDELFVREFKQIPREELLNTLQTKSRSEFVELFTNLSVNAEIFNYSALNKQKFIDSIKGDNLAARSARFVSWSFYYKDLVDGMFREYQAGNKKPVKDLAKMAMIWAGASGLAASTDLPFVSDLGTYSLGRIPGVSPVISLATSPQRVMSGIVTPAISTVLVAPVAGLDYLTDLAGSDSDTYDYISEKMWRDTKGQPALKPFRLLYEFFEGE